MQYIAHVRKDEKTGQWSKHDLNDHLQKVANRSQKFAQLFGSGDWAYVAGLWHDLGKFLPDWQKYIRKKTGYDEDAHIEGYGGRPNHSTAGAVLTMERFTNHPAARILAYIIAGHHAGLPDWYHQSEVGGALESRLYADSTNVDRQLDVSELNQIRSLPKVQKYLSVSLPKSIPLAIKNLSEMESEREHFHLWIRMLFSCLVDADFLDTEAFMNPGHATQRGQCPSIQELSNKFDRYMTGKQSNLGKNADKPINIQRRKILEQCREKAELSPGFFTLTVPTGGGKTLSSIAFALRHALKHGKQRIITAIPYTSIIEQTAKVYKYGTDDDVAIKAAIENGKVLFGEDAVLEHHSNIDPDKESNKSRLASENWDASIIVTTNVQLLESLFASRTSSCRKLHNLVNSVIILDEAQILPPEYFKPTLSVLRGLVKHFGVTIVFCTATQPAFCGKIGHGQTVFQGLTEVVDIIENPRDFEQPFKRVEIVSSDLNKFMDWDEVADNLRQHPQVLCVVNTRKDCRDLHALMPAETVHLSANMCGEERSERISFIKNKLKTGEDIRVISTQLVEAGVDIDFPVVYRALAGIDSIAQAAGRCNREGKLKEEGRLGQMVIFQPPKPAPVGLLRKGEDAAKSIFRTKNVQELDPDLYSEYFKQFYASVNDFDKPRFSERLVKESGEFKLQFRTFAQDVKLIDDTSQQGIIVWYQGKERNSLELIDYLRRHGPERWITRKLQRFIVNVPRQLFYNLFNEGHLEEVHGYWVQKSSGLYKPGLGLLPDSTKWDRELFIV